MQLEIAEFLLGVNVSAAGFDLHVIFVHDPFRRAMVALPLGKICAVEQNDGVRGRGRAVAEGGAGVTTVGLGRLGSCTCHLPEGSMGVSV